MPESMTQNNFKELSNFVRNSAKGVAEKSMIDAAAEIKR